MTSASSQDVFAHALLQPGSAPPAGIANPDALRFAVYRNNVYVGLVNALASRFPVTRALVGEDFFSGMARVYAASHLPRTPLMFAYGDDFPDFVAAFAPARDLRYLPDVARIEAFWTQAYHAADAPTLEVRQLAAIPPDRLAEQRFAAHPAARIVASRYPIGAIWEAHQHAEPVGVDVRGAQTVLVARPRMQVRVHVLPGEDAGFAEALLAGAALGEAAQRAGSPHFDVGTALVGLVSLGAFHSIIPEDRP
jgi:hypothetical protein